MAVESPRSLAWIEHHMVSCAFLSLVQRVLSLWAQSSPAHCSLLMLLHHWREEYSSTWVHLLRIRISLEVSGRLVASPSLLRGMLRRPILISSLLFIRVPLLPPEGIKWVLLLAGIGLVSSLMLLIFIIEIDLLPLAVHRLPFHFPGPFLRIVIVFIIDSPQLCRPLLLQVYQFFLLLGQLVVQTSYLLVESLHLRLLLFSLHLQHLFNSITGVLHSLEFSA